MGDMRIGFGYDSHRFEAGRRLVLGGVEIPGETGLRGHSDADVVIHAVIDALLKLLSAVVAEVGAAGWTVGNIDVTVICERPRIGPRVEAMRARLAELLWPGEARQVGRVSVKGKTNEGMDDVGAGAGIEVHAVCLLKGKSE